MVTLGSCVRVLAAAATVGLLARAAPAASLGTAFTYQGQLQQNATPVTGPCDFQFGLFDAATGGAQVSSTQTASAVTLTNALFTVPVDFGAVFTGDETFLEISVRCPAGSGSYVTLTPRQQLTATPNALFAKSVQFFRADASNTIAGAGARGGEFSGGCPIPDPLPPPVCYFCATPIDAAANVTIGSFALSAAVPCGGTTDNTAVGFEALTNNLGGNNTALGSHAGSNLTTGINNIDIGNLGAAGESNTIRIGDPILHTATYIAGINGTSITSGMPVFVDASGRLGTANSAPISVSKGGTGASNPVSARTNIGAAASGANGDITSLSGITVNFNTKAGDGALRDLVGGFYNTAFGSRALVLSNGTLDNSAFGADALLNTTSGSSNTALGAATLLDNTTGNGNVAVGDLALQHSTGDLNIALGTDAGRSLETGDSNIYIGNVGVATESHTIRLGEAATHTATFIAGISGATSSGGVAVYVNASGQLGTLTSSARFKENIEDIGEASSALMKLRPVRFHYKKNIDASGLEQYGLVAEDVAKVYPGLVVYDAEGRPSSVRYHFLTPMLLNEVQKQTRQIAEQRELINAQAQRIIELTDRAQQIEALTARLTQVEAVVQSAGGAAAVPARCTDDRGL
jgi:hypothetical protein